MQKKVLVSGCFDLLHSGHVAFFEEAAQYGELYVALGSDRTVLGLKGQMPVNNQEERLYMVRAIRSVKHAFISSGSGILDFEPEFIELQPDYFVVNRDGHTPDKAELCQKFGVEYIILKREPHGNLLPRSTTALRRLDHMPFRIDLAGGWLDQPFVSKFHPGPVITISIEPTINFNDRSGMASSTRHSARDLWGSRLPAGSPEKLAKILFCYDNPPGTEEVSGSQDAIGIVFPGLAFAHYDGKYWPEYIKQITHEPSLQFVERVLYLVSLGPRHADYNVLENTHIDPQAAKLLADATLNCWDAIEQFDLPKFGSSIRASFEAQIRMFPNMINPVVDRLIEKYRDTTLGWKLSGAGGGGYLILVSEKPIENAIQVIARRTDP
jgi:cytidyltransferase-like protein